MNAFAGTIVITNEVTHLSRLALWLLPVSLCAASARYARLADFDGQVEVQLQAADAWQPALRNMPLPELAWIRTGASSRVEVELDEGSVLRLAANSQAELSDYTRLSTGQRITLLSLDHGLAYFTGAAEGKDALIVAVPGAQANVGRAVRLRLEARDAWSQICTLEGGVRFSSPMAEFHLPGGRTVRVDPAHPAKFYLYPEIAPRDTDRWSEERDTLLASSTSSAHVPLLHYGLADLDAQGVWVDSPAGTVWKPKAAGDWTPFRNGKWLWYDGLGYTWISAEAWGWLPYHYGRWMQDAKLGWLWAPGQSTVFKPGEVYWFRSAKLAGWGPLASGEEWQPPAAPRLFLKGNTTYAPFLLDAREIDPAGFVPPAEASAEAFAFALALPSPSFPAARLEATRPVLRAGSTRIVPVLNGVTFDTPAVEAAAPAPADAPPVASSYVAPPPPEQPVVIVNPPPQAVETFYPVPVYTGIVVVNPPEHDHDGDKHGKPAAGATSAPPPAQPPAQLPRRQPEPPRERLPEPERPVK